ncbi:hypothetical protein, partial [Bradyrhizobium sp. AS23.2]|uniref:hypothetical protein n=1 Tax=Bradyrhizobium sp. AS23.2 TaxID=1680155 RepID=UPI001AD84E59
MIASWVIAEASCKWSHIFDAIIDWHKCIRDVFEFGFGSFATNPTDHDRHPMSASSRLRPKRRGTAICREGPNSDS